MRRRKSVLVALAAVGICMIGIGIVPTVAPDLLQKVARRGIAYLQAAGHLHQAAAVYEQRLSSYLSDARWMAIRRYALPGVCWIAFSVAALRGRRRTAAAAAVAELIVFGLGYNPAIRVEEIAPKPVAIQTMERRDPERRWLMASSGDFLPPNAATVWRIRDIVPYDILTSEESVRRLLPAGYDPVTFRLPPSASPGQLRALANLGVRFWVTPAGVEELSGEREVPLPPNEPPPGLAAGAVVSLLGLMLTVMLLVRSPPRPDPRPTR